MRADTQYGARTVYRATASHRRGRTPRVLIPPKKKARVKSGSPIWKERNRNIRGRARLGKGAWHKDSGYGLRAKAETTASRCKVIFGSAMSARKLAAQRAEARIRRQVLKKMTTLGMPDGYMVG